METVKFKVKKGEPIFSKREILFYVILILIFISPEIYQIYSPEYDAENFESRDFFKLFYLWIPFLLFSKYPDFIMQKRINKNWDTFGANTVEIPIKEIGWVFDKDDSVEIQVKKNSFYLQKKEIEAFDNFKEVVKIYEDFKPLRYLYGFLLFIAVIIFPIMLKNDPLVDSYNFKYYLPTLQIKTTQIEATFIEEIHNNKKYKVIITRNEVGISTPSGWDLPNKIINKSALKLLPTSTPIKIKIRTKDYENYLKTGKFDKNLRFYELEANGDILYQKRGLRN